MKKGIGGHQQSIGVNQEWITPKHILAPMGEFDLDPCSPIVPPWPTAKSHYSILDDGLKKEWYGRVWLNPPYDRRFISQWLKKFSEHGNGISLTFNRSDTEATQDYIYEKADGIFLLRGRIIFCDVYGNLATTSGENGKPKVVANSGAPSLFAAFGRYNMEVLHNCGLPGKFVPLKYTTVITVGIDRTWRTVISITLEKLDGTGSLSSIYSTVEKIAPSKVRNNQNYKAKVRQQLQKHFTKIKKGHYATSI